MHITWCYLVVLIGWLCYLFWYYHQLNEKWLYQSLTACIIIYSCLPFYHSYLHCTVQRDYKSACWSILFVVCFIPSAENTHHHLWKYANLCALRLFACLHHFGKVIYLFVWSYGKLSGHLLSLNLLKKYHNLSNWKDLLGSILNVYLLDEWSYLVKYKAFIYCYCMIVLQNDRSGGEK